MTETLVASGMQILSVCGHSTIIKLQIVSVTYQRVEAPDDDRVHEVG